MEDRSVGENKLEDVSVSFLESFNRDVQNVLGQIYDGHQAHSTKLPTLHVVDELVCVDKFRKVQQLSTSLEGRQNVIATGLLESFCDLYRRLSNVDALSSGITTSVLRSLLYSLRNLCADPQSQSNIAKVILPCVEEDISLFKSNESLLLPLLQLLCNIVVQNETNQQLVWSKVYPWVLCELLRSGSNKVISMTAALYHYCTASCYSRRRAFAETIEGNTLICLLLDSLTSDSTDYDEWWISYIFQKLVADEQGIQVIIEAAQNYRGYATVLALFEFVYEYLQSTEESSTQSTVTSDGLILHRLPLSSIIHLFKFARDLFSSFQTMFQLSRQSQSLLVILLEVLGFITCNLPASLNEILAKDGSIELLVDLLKYGCDGHKTFYARCQTLRILGNMMYQNQWCQDQVRQFGGIPYILNHFVVDENNPYMREWAVFALRVLCTDNPTNQKAIEDILSENNLSRLTNVPELAAMNLEPRIINGKVRIVPIDS